MDTQEKRIKSRKRSDKESAPGEAPVRPRRVGKRRKRAQVAPYNPGQVRLLEELVTEFACHRAVAQVPGGGEMAFRHSDDIPFLGAFIEFKIRDLVSQQRRLAHLWTLSEAV